MFATQDSRVGADGVWREVLAAPEATRGRPALFLDRDGVIVDYVAFLHRPRDVRLTAGIAGLIGSVHLAGAAVVVVTNQSGIGRGLYGWDDLAAVDDEIVARLAQGGAHLDAVFACPFHPQAPPPYRHGDHPARKPNPGMLLAAGELLGTDLGRSWMIGDRALDMKAAQRAGLAGGLLLATGADEVERAMALGEQGFAVARIAHLDEARRHIDWLA